VVQYVDAGAGPTLVKVVCDACGRSVASDTLMDVEVCALVGWAFDFGAVRCLLCQDDTPEWLLRRLGRDVRAA
jgi:hypothetical protein